MPLIQEGQVHYGENKIKEAMQKRPDVKEKFSKIKLHMLGKVQTNKVKF